MRYFLLCCLCVLGLIAGLALGQFLSRDAAANMAALERPVSLVAAQSMRGTVESVDALARTFSFSYPSPYAPHKDESMWVSFDEKTGVSRKFYSTAEEVATHIQSEFVGRNAVLYLDRDDHGAMHAKFLDAPYR